jgi:hypothetical protein
VFFEDGFLIEIKVWRLQSRSTSASVSSLQYFINIDRGRNGCGAGGKRQSRRSNPEITKSCSGSGIARSAVPGWQLLVV